MPGHAADTATREQLLEALHHCWAERVDRYEEPLARRVIDRRIDTLLDQLTALDHHQAAG